MIFTRIPFRGGDEWDGLSRRAKRILRWRAGERRRIKAGYWRRFRRKSRRAALDAVLELSPESFDRLLAILASPPPPNDFLIDLVRRSPLWSRRP